MKTKKIKKKKNNRRSRKHRQKDKIFVFLVVSLVVLVGLLVAMMFYNQANFSGAEKTISKSHRTTSKSTPEKTSTSRKKKEKKAVNPVLPAEGPVLVLGQNFPDPKVVSFDGKYYMYGTNILGNSLPLATSVDNRSYQTVGSALASRPSYSNNVSTTSPDVEKIGNQFVMYADISVGVVRPAKLYVIGTAIANSPAGPFTPTTNPLIGAPAGSLDNFFDPDVVAENGKNYLLFATDGTLGNNIWINELTTDGLSTVGDSTKLLDYQNIKDPTGAPVTRVESPALIKSADGTYVLFYAANDAEQNNCYVGYATSQAITGPYTDHGPLLTTAMFGGVFNGPGELSLLKDDSGQYIVFNAWVGEHNGFNIISGGRYVYELKFVWKDGHVPYFSTKVIQ